MLIDTEPACEVCISKPLTAKEADKLRRKLAKAEKENEKLKLRIQKTDELRERVEKLREEYKEASDELNEAISDCVAPQGKLAPSS